MNPIGGDALSSLWAALACLLVFSRVLALLASRVGAPPIVGALLAGVLLNHEVLGSLWPAAQHWLFPGTSSSAHLLGGITNLCLLFVCFLLGIETDVVELRKLGRRLPLAAAWTFVLPFAAGAGIAVWASQGMIGRSGSELALVLLLGTATAVSSLPVIAWMVRGLDLAARWPGRLAVGVATAQDAAGFVLLAVAVAVTSGGGAVRLLTVVLGFAALAGVLLFGGRPVGFLLARTSSRDREAGAGALTVAFATMLIFAAASQSAHISGALGAFVAGVMVSRSAVARTALITSVEAIIAGVFVPVYFASAGVSLQFRLVTSGGAAIALAALVVFGFAAKAVAAAISARGLGRRPGERPLFATLLNGRGTLQVLIASVALRNGIITDVGYSVIVTAALLTSLLVAPLARSFTRATTSSKRAAVEL